MFWNVFNYNNKIHIQKKIAEHMSNFMHFIIIIFSLYLYLYILSIIFINCKKGKIFDHLLRKGIIKKYIACVFEIKEIYHIEIWKHQNRLFFTCIFLIFFYQMKLKM